MSRSTIFGLTLVVVGVAMAVFGCLSISGNQRNDYITQQAQDAFKAGLPIYQNPHDYSNWNSDRETYHGAYMACVLEAKEKAEFYAAFEDATLTEVE